MRSWTRADRLAVILVALAGINVGILDQVGHGLVSDVEAKYSDLGADWIVLRHTFTTNGKSFDMERVMAEIAALRGVEEVMWALASDQVLPEPPTPPSATGPTFRQLKAQEILLLGPGYDAATHPYIYTLHGDRSENTTFYRTEIIWSEGRAPDAPGEIAVPIAFAAERGLAVGDDLVIPWDRGFRGPGNGTDRSFRITGLFDPILTGNIGDDVVRLIAIPDEGLRAAASAPGVMPNRLLVFVRAPLPTLGDAAGRVERVLESHNLTLGVAGDLAGLLGPTSWGGTVIIRHEFGGGDTSGPGPSPSASPSATPTPSASPDPATVPEGVETGDDDTGGGDGGDQNRTIRMGSGPEFFVGGDTFAAGPPTDVDMYANAGLIESAFAAAQRAGTWFRFLGAGSVLLAAIGIGFVVRANARRMTMEVAIRQATGFRTDRILGAWAWHSVGVALAGSALALVVVVLPASLGLGPALLGVALVTDPTTWLIVPALAIAMHLLAGAPMVIRLARRPPAVNLREVDPR